MKFSELLENLDLSDASHSLSIAPTCNPEITGVAPLDEAVAGTLSYVEGVRFGAMIAKTGASVLILPAGETWQQQATERGIAWIATAQPKLIFAKAIRYFYQPFSPAAGIHSTAVIDAAATIGEGVYIGPHAVIAAGVTVGDFACIHANAVIYPGVTIGERTILHANCTIHERSQIGRDCVIHSGAVIGAEGFGFVPTREGWFKLEQSGCVVLEDGVDIGCNSTIDRPAMGVTRIGRNTKLDNLVHIAHNCQIGENCAFAAQVGLAGGVKVGNGVILAGQVGVANQVQIGDGAIASAQTGIYGDVAPREVVSGSPAVPNKLYLKVSAIYKRLPEIYQAFKQLQKIKSSR